MSFLMVYTNHLWWWLGDGLWHCHTSIKRMRKLKFRVQALVNADIRMRERQSHACGLRMGQTRGKKTLVSSFLILEHYCGRIAQLRRTAKQCSRSQVRSRHRSCQVSWMPHCSSSSKAPQVNWCSLPHPVRNRNSQTGKTHVQTQFNVGPWRHSVHNLRKKFMDCC